MLLEDYKIFSQFIYKMIKIFMIHDDKIKYEAFNCNQLNKELCASVAVKDIHYPVNGK